MGLAAGGGRAFANPVQLLAVHMQPAVRRFRSDLMNSTQVHVVRIAGGTRRFPASFHQGLSPISGTFVSDSEWTFSLRRKQKRAHTPFIVSELAARNAGRAGPGYRQPSGTVRGTPASALPASG